MDSPDAITGSTTASAEVEATLKAKMQYQKYKPTSVESEDLSRTGRMLRAKCETVVKNSEGQTWNLRTLVCWATLRARV